MVGSRGFVAGRVGLEGAATNVSAATKRQTPSIVGTRAVESQRFHDKINSRPAEGVPPATQTLRETQRKQECYLPRRRRPIPRSVVEPCEVVRDSIKEIGVIRLAAAA